MTAPDPKSVAARAAGLHPDERACLIDLPTTPWLMGDWTWRDHECRRRFYDLGMVDAAFPEAKRGDSGRQFWQFNALGAAVRDHLLQQGDGR